MTAKRDIKGLYRDELAKLCEPAYRVDQILQWVYEKQAGSFTEMSNLPAPLRDKLAADFELNAIHSVRTKHATDTTDKFLFQLRDNELIETVLIPATPGLTSQSDRHTICVSTQVGCAYGCKFCASGLEGVKRNLTAAEIVDQVVQVQRLTGERVSNLVVMGMGEPLANYDNVLRALRILNAPWALGLGARKMTISTVGLVPRIKQLAEEPMQIGLAISLHGVTDAVVFLLHRLSHRLTNEGKGRGRSKGACEQEISSRLLHLGLCCNVLPCRTAPCLQRWWRWRWAAACLRLPPSATCGGCQLTQP